MMAQEKKNLREYYSNWNTSVGFLERKGDCFINGNNEIVAFIYYTVHNFSNDLFYPMAYLVKFCNGHELTELAVIFCELKTSSISNLISDPCCYALYQVIDTYITTKTIGLYFGESKEGNGVMIHNRFFEDLSNAICSSKYR
jgi:hypothetical protein